MMNITKHPDKKYIDYRYGVSAIQKIMFNKTIPLHWHEFYEIELFLSGNGIALMNGKEYKVERGSLFLITPIDIHSYQLEGNTETINISFTSESIEDIGITEKISMYNGAAIKLQNDDIEWILTMSKKLREEIRHRKFMSRKYISQIMGCIIIEILRNTAKNSVHDKAPVSIQQAIHYIYLHFREDITLEMVAEQAGLSKNHFSEKFHKNVGMTFIEYITKVRLAYAVRLILYTNLSINDVSYFSGFNSVPYFLRTFKKKFNISPLAYRKQNSIKNK